jgi:hypothetical protein
MTPNPNPAGPPPNPKLAESPKTCPPCPRFHGLGSTDDFPLGGDSSMLQSENPPQQYSWVAESLANDPDFIKVGFHRGRIITTVVDIQDDCANIEALYMDQESTSTWINVSSSCLIFGNRPCLVLTPFLCRNWLNILAAEINS